MWNWVVWTVWDWNDVFAWVEHISAEVWWQVTDWSVKIRGVLDLSTIANKKFDERVRIITAFYPEYLQEVDKKVNDFLAPYNLENEVFKSECKLAVRERVEWVIGDNTYSNTATCTVEQWWDKLSHLLEKYWWYWSSFWSDQRKTIEGIQKWLTKISIEIAWLCFSKAWYTEKWVYLVWLANTRIN